MSLAVVGREDQLHRLDNALHSVRSGSGEAIFLLGEGGIGKSRLATEVTCRARSFGMAILKGRACSIGPPVPFRPIAEAVLPCLDAAGASHYPELAPYLPALTRLVEQRRPDIDGNPQNSLIVVAESVLRLVAAVSNNAGCALLLEDLHDADAETLAVVDYLIDHVDRHKVLLLLTAQPELGPALDLARAAQRRRRCDILELPGLAGPQVRQLIGQYLRVAPAAVPGAVANRLSAAAAGNPFVIEELLASLVDSHVLVKRHGGWSLVAEVPTELPHTVVDSVTQRAERLGRRGHTMLQVAALLGHRFPLSAVQTVLDDADVIEVLRAAIAAQLLTADEPDPDWYAFRHALIADALLASMVPAERARLAGHVADQIEARNPRLPGPWCQVVAELRRTSGQTAEAARMYAEAGQRALTAGAPACAVTLLEQALSLADDEAPPAARTDRVVLLVQALIMAGHLTRAAEHMSSLETAAAPISRQQRVELLTSLAWAAAISGRWIEGRRWAGRARGLLGADAPVDQTAPIDAADSCLIMSAQGPGWRDQAVRLAQRAVDTAVKVPLPVTACQALEVLGIIGRSDNAAESDVHFERVLRLADNHRLPLWRVRALGNLGGNDFMKDGTTVRLEYALQEALRAGALREAYYAEGSLALAAVLCGNYPTAQSIVDRCAPAASRLQMDDICQYMTMTLAVAAAHQGRRQDMRTRLAELSRWGDEAAPLLILASGLATAFCALLEEDVAAAYATLCETLEREGRLPTIHSLSGTSGLRVLLGVLRGELGLAEYGEASARGSARLRWNWQFTSAAHAVLLGRAGRCDDAAGAMTEALRAAEPFPLARHLILRLTAEAALADGWGEPTHWARAAEEFFQRVDLPTSAMACRSLLRSAGAVVPPHRDGWDLVPAELRRHGVTKREYDVFRLLADWLSNSEIGNRLFISPRTVEKHVAGLLAKTGLSNRTALCRLAANATTQLPI
jgi:DNA-binding CsgD family transcriptional regulator